MLNAGQACISPEYILVQHGVRERLTNALKQSLMDFYGNDAESMKSCPDIGRIINQRHFERVKGLLEDKKVKQKIVFGGDTDASQNYVQPTLIADPSNDTDIMNVSVKTCSSLLVLSHSFFFLFFLNRASLPMNHAERSVRSTPCHSRIQYLARSYQCCAIPRKTARLVYLFQQAIEH